MRLLRVGVLAFVLIALLSACGGQATEDAAGLSVDNVTANLTLPTDTGAVYMQIHNGTEQDDALLGATIPGCGVIELHEVIMENDIMQMRPVEGGRIIIPAGETVELKRGGLHVMCIGKSGDFVVGGTVPVTLEFENAGPIEVTAAIIDPGEMPAGMEMEGDSMSGSGE